MKQLLAAGFMLFGSVFGTAALAAMDKIAEHRDWVSYHVTHGEYLNAPHSYNGYRTWTHSIHGVGGGVARFIVDLDASDCNWITFGFTFPSEKQLHVPPTEMTGAVSVDSGDRHPISVKMMKAVGDGVIHANIEPMPYADFLPSMIRGSILKLDWASIGGNPITPISHRYSLHGLTATLRDTEAACRRHLQARRPGG